MGLQTMKDVLKEQLEDLYSAETQLVTMLPKMEKAAHHDELKTAFREHLEETKGHVTRVEEALGELGFSPPRDESRGMKGLVAEGERVIQMPGDPSAKDVAIIAAAQKFEHYEISAWGTVRQLAKECGYDGIEDIADQTLDEESQADKFLTKIATGSAFKTGANKQPTR